MFAPSK